jgi:type IV pilus assembly protein PilQ
MRSIVQTHLLLIRWDKVIIIPFLVVALVFAMAFAEGQSEQPKPENDHPAEGKDTSVSAKPEAPRQIAIEGLVVEVGEDMTRELGLEYSYNRSEARSPGSVLKGATFRFPTAPRSVTVPDFVDTDSAFKIDQQDRELGFGINIVGMDISRGVLAARLRALVNTGDAEIKSQPMAVALENTKAIIETVDEVPFQDVKFLPNQTSPLLDVSFEKVGVRLEVTPIIENEKLRLVRLNIEKIEVSSVSSFITIRGVSRPLFAKSDASTEVVIGSGETLVIGGLKSQRDREAVSGIPFLRKVPLIGILFRNTRVIKEQTDVLFFITPYILEPGENPILPVDFSHYPTKTS